MSTRIGNITIQLDGDLIVRPQAEGSDTMDERCSVFVDGGSAVRLQLCGGYEDLRKFANGILEATDTVEQRKLAAALPLGQSF